LRDFVVCGVPTGCPGSTERSISMVQPARVESPRGFAYAGKPAVLFDVDGTLVDSNFHHVVAWHRAFLDVDKEVPCWRILGLIGRSGSELVRILLGDELAEQHESHVKKL